MINKPEGDGCLLGLPSPACRLPGSHGDAFLRHRTQACHRRAPHAKWRGGLPFTEGFAFRLVMSSQKRYS